MNKKFEIDYKNLEDFDYKDYYENEYKRRFYNLDRSKNKWFSKYVKVKIIEKWIERYNINKESLLDAGGGTGTYAWHFMNEFKNVIVSDISKTALDMIPEEKIKKVCCDVFNHPLKSESIDCILLIDVFEHLKEKDLNKLMEEMNRLLKKGGFLIIYSSLYGWGGGSVYNRLFNKNQVYFGEEEMGHLNRLTLEQYKKLFTETKFRVMDYYFYSQFFQPLTDSIKDKSAILFEKVRYFLKKNKNNYFDEQRKGQTIKESIRESKKNIFLKVTLYFFSWMNYLDILIFGKLFKGNSVFFLLKKEQRII